MSICFMDCETTVLDPLIHVPWEIAIIKDDINIRSTWRVQLTEQERELANPSALKVGRYYERVEAYLDEPPYEPPRRPWRWSDMGIVHVEGRSHFASWLVRVIGDSHIVGMVPSFDDRFVGDFLRRQSSVPIWHYHLVDVEAMIAGKLGISPPWNSDQLSREIGVDPDQFERHTALGDCEWTKALYEAVMS